MSTYSCVGIFAAGKMGLTLLEGIRAMPRPPDVWAAARTQRSCAQLQAHTTVPVMTDYANQLPYTDILILSVPPREIAGVCCALAEAGTLPPTTIIVSVVAGVSIAAIELNLKPLHNPVVRAMPPGREF